MFLLIHIFWDWFPLGFCLGFQLCLFSLHLKHELDFSWFRLEIWVRPMIWHHSYKIETVLTLINQNLSICQCTRGSKLVNFPSHCEPTLKKNPYQKVLNTQAKSYSYTRLDMVFYKYFDIFFLWFSWNSWSSLLE